MPAFFDTNILLYSISRDPDESPPLAPSAATGFIPKI